MSVIAMLRQRQGIIAPCVVWLARPGVCGVHSVPVVLCFAVSVANWGHPRSCGLMTDWDKLHGQDLLNAVDAIAIKKFGQSIMPDPQITKVVGEIVVGAMRAKGTESMPTECDVVFVPLRSA